MNSSLLRPSGMDVEKNKIFGKFDGFTLKPIANDTRKVARVQPVSKNTVSDHHIVPTREAPPPPVPKHQNVNAAVDKFNKLQLNGPSAPPALPPLNKGSTARPIISNPILETSTCDAKEMPTSLKYPTLGPAPTPPETIEVLPEVLINPMSTTLDKKAKDGTLSRLQSFLKKENKPEKFQKQLKTIDKDRLKDIEISSPILITQVPLKDSPDADEKKAHLNRTQSMRDPPSPPAIKPSLTSFGSMRHPRPKSIVDRPTIPPPPRPPAVNTSPKMTESPHEYDSAEAKTPEGIYAVIEESPLSPPRQQGSIESMGLLGEIVNEIEQRNFDAIYIAGTFKKPSPNYANIKSPVLDEEYQAESNNSTSSSGYMRPIGRIPPSQSFTNTKMPSTTSSNSVSSFKSAKSNSGVTSPQQESVHSASSKMKKSSSDLGGSRKKSVDESEYKTPTSNRPVIELKKTPTPPSITLPPKKTTSTSKVPSKPKTFQKPTTTPGSVLPSKSTPSFKAASSLSNGSAKISTSNSSSSKVLSAAASKKSNVAALQQKFESANSN